MTAVSRTILAGGISMHTGKLMTRPNLQLQITVLLGLSLAGLAQAQLPTVDQSAAPTASGNGVPAGNATHPELSVWAGYAESDNVLRTQVAERGSYGDVGVMFNAAHEAPRLTGRMDSNIEFRKYSAEGIDDEKLGRLDGDLDFKLAKDVFHWVFRETFDQGRTNAFAALGPGNRENINVFSSGPQLRLPLGQRTRLALGGTYSYRRYQDSQYVDSDALLYDLGVLRQITPTAEIGILASTNDVDYTDVTISPYKIDALNLRYSKTLATGAVLAEWGRNELHTPNAVSDSPFFSFQWFRDVTARGTLSIAAQRRLTDTGGLATPVRSDAPRPPQADVLLSTAAVDRKSLSIGYSIAAPRTTISVSVAASDDHYFGDATLDNRSTTGNFTLSRSPTARLRFGVSFDSLSREFNASTLASADDRERTTSAWVNRSLSRRLGIAFSLTRYDRRGIQPSDENRYEVRLIYSPIPSGDAGVPFVVH